MSAYWFCPSDRELELRSKLKSGWSSRGSAVEASNDGTGANLSETEHATIMQVLDRSNKIQELENERIRKLQERLDKIRRLARGKGKNCILCNEEPSFFRKFQLCKDCKNVLQSQSPSRILLCKICSESREVLKKANLWIHLGANNGDGGAKASQRVGISADGADWASPSALGVALGSPYK